jgi:2-methylisocitrate lyase-like PEP mutase family enzyme
LKALDMKSTAAALRARISQPGLITAPGVYDMISARIADRMGFPALYMTGFGVVASYLGLPDAGLATYTDMAGRVAQICSISATPLIADADTGYGGLLNVAHTVRGYINAGAAALQLEDQEFPKKCGHTPGRRVIPIDDMVRKIRVAIEARGGDDILIIARTDARTAHGLDEALRRADAYANAGAVNGKHGRRRQDTGRLSAEAGRARLQNCDFSGNGLSCSRCCARLGVSDAQT